MNYQIGMRGVVVRNGVRYQVQIVRMHGSELLCESYAGLYFYGWVDAADFEA